MGKLCLWRLRRIISAVRRILPNWFGYTGSRAFLQSVQNRSSSSLPPIGQYLFFDEIFPFEPSFPLFYSSLSCQIWGSVTKRTECLKPLFITTVGGARTRDSMPRKRLSTELNRLTTQPPLTLPESRLYPTKRILISRFLSVNEPVKPTQYFQQETTALKRWSSSGAEAPSAGLGSSFTRVILLNKRRHSRRKNSLYIYLWFIEITCR